MIITIAMVAVVVYVAVRRYGGSKLVLQVTGDSMDIVNEAKLPSVIIQRHVWTHQIKIKSSWHFDMGNGLNSNKTIMILSMKSLKSLKNALKHNLHLFPTLGGETGQVHRRVDFIWCAFTCVTWAYDNMATNKWKFRDLETVLGGHQQQRHRHRNHGAPGAGAPLCFLIYSCIIYALCTHHTSPCL